MTNRRPRVVDHHRTCRRPTPVLIVGWDRRPLTLCPECGRTAPASEEGEA